MMISFGEDLRRRDSGKHKFLSRLAIQFEMMGHEIVDGKSDIFLHIGRNLEKCKSDISVMRLDGLILNTRVNYSKSNKKIMKLIDKSDAVVYQNEFCRDAYEKFLGVEKTHACILNAADSKEFLPRKPDGKFFLANCKWRPHKRLRQTINAFLESGVDADLLVTGEPDYKVRDERIKYVGWVEPDELRDILSQSLGLIHLSWLDWCPNAMVEAAVAGCPAIYSDSGGSKYVGSGIPIPDIDWNFEPLDLYSPPPMDPNILVSAIRKLYNDPISVEPKGDLLIDVAAKRYVDFFEFLRGNRHED